jgi:hypothetical protein
VYISDGMLVTYDASAHLGEFRALSIAAANGESDSTYVASHSSEQVGNSTGDLIQLLTFLSVGKNGNVLCEESSENEQENTRNL